jgi:HlyD family secretion protein
MSTPHAMRRLGPPALTIALILTGCSEPPPPPAFQTATVSTRNIVVSVSAAGIVEPVSTIEVKSKASGEIYELPVETGDAVVVGDLLARIDPRVPRNALQQAEADLEVAQAQLANAESQLRRAEELYKTQSITEQEFEDANLQAANAKAQLVRAQRSLEDARIAFEDTEVRAPVPGVVIQKNVEVGTVISSATNVVGGGTALLQMANLDTVQVRTLVDETDIGKIRPGMDVTITVDAYPNQPFEGNVLKIEPQATVEQSVTMFPVLVRIGNPEGLLRPGMNAEVEVHVGARENVVAVPNAALRTDRDLASAAQVLGLDPEAVRQQVAEAQAAARGGRPPAGDSAAGEAQAAANTMTLPNGQVVTLPEGVTAEQVSAVFQKLREAGGPQGLTAEDRDVMNKFRTAMGNAPRSRPQQAGTDYLFGGSYVVFTMRGGVPAAVPVRTGLTDLDHSEVIRGLVANDTVLILPTAGLVQAQQEFQERIDRVRGTGLPGVQRQSTSSSAPGGSR